MALTSKLRVPNEKFCLAGYEDVGRGNNARGREEDCRGERWPMGEQWSRATLVEGDDGRWKRSRWIRSSVAPPSWQATLNLGVGEHTPYSR